MSLSENERKTILVKSYEKRKEEVEEQRFVLLNKFRNYVLENMKNTNKPLEIRYYLINNEPSLSYEDLKIEDTFTMDLVSFKYDFQTEMIIDYIKNRYQVIKKTEKIEDLPDEYVEGPRTFRKAKQRPTEASMFEQEKIFERIQRKVDAILTKVFKGELTFEDSEFQKLVYENFNLEKELQTLNKTIEALTTRKIDRILNEISDDKLKTI